MIVLVLGVLGVAVLGMAVLGLDPGRVVHHALPDWLTYPEQVCKFLDISPEVAEEFRGKYFVVEHVDGHAVVRTSTVQHLRSNTDYQTALYRFRREQKRAAQPQQFHSRKNPNCEYLRVDQLAGRTGDSKVTTTALERLSAEIPQVKEYDGSIWYEERAYKKWLREGGLDKARKLQREIDLAAEEQRYQESIAEKKQQEIIEQVRAEAAQRNREIFERARNFSS